MAKITVVGLGYVGMSLATLLAKDHEVIVYDIDEKKANLINKNKSTISDPLIESYIKNKVVKLTAVTKKEEAYSDSSYYIVATPTNYDENKSQFDTESVEKTIKDIISHHSDGCIIIKSTIPYGFTSKMRKKFRNEKIFFSPEFLREDNALYDNLYPSRIIIGPSSEESKGFAKILKNSAKKNSVQMLLVSSEEAESIKLFSNSFLAMRVAFFNELDSFAMTKDISAKKIIQGICSDNRIGDYYNNPSFGYGGYCLPKDTKQLLSTYDEIPQKLIQAIVDSNETRKKYLADLIESKNIKTIGFYRLIAKTDSTNFKSSAISSLMKILKNKFSKVLIYEPLLKGKSYEGIIPTQSFKEFTDQSELIVANRISSELKNVSSKVFSRDIFGNL